MTTENRANGASTATPEAGTTSPATAHRSHLPKPDCGHLDWCCNDNGQVELQTLSRGNSGGVGRSPATVPPYLVYQLQQATWAIGSLLDVLQAEDDNALHIGHAMRSGIVSALTVIHRDSLSSVMEQICNLADKAEAAKREGGAA